MNKMKKYELRQMIKEEINKTLNENKIINNFESGLLIYIMDAYQSLEGTELIELDELYDTLNWFLKKTQWTGKDNYEEEQLKTFILNRSQIEHYLIDNINKSIEVQESEDIFYYTPLVKKNKIYIKFSLEPDSKLSNKYDPSEDIDLPIRIKNKEEFEKYAKELKVKGYYWYGGVSPLDFNPAEQLNTRGKPMGHPFRLVRINPDNELSKQLGYDL